METLPHFSLNSLSKTALSLFLVGVTLLVTPQIFPRLVLASNPTYSAMVIDYAYQPQHINVTTGTQVIWIYASNGQTVHTVTSSPQTNTTQGGTPLISSGSLSPGQSFSYTFYKHGVYPIQCSLHPTIPKMNGWVNVTGTDLQPPSTSASSPDITLYLIGGVAAGVVVLVSVALLLRRRTKKTSSTSPG